jgi:hypothetical protein
MTKQIVFLGIMFRYPFLTIPFQTQIRIGWKFVDAGTVPIDHYEQHHEKRSKIEMLMPATERMNLLVKEWGVSQKDIIQSIRTSNRVKHLRRQTIVNDQDALLIQLRQLAKVIKRCFKPLSKLMKGNDMKKSTPSWCTEGTTDSLDKTRHRGMNMVELEKIDVEHALVTAEPHEIEEISIQPKNEC